MPVLRGIGGNLTCPLGVATVSVEVQGLKKTIEIYVVEDYVLSYLDIGITWTFLYREA